MTLFLHGGPGLSDYMQCFFSQTTLLAPHFYTHFSQALTLEDFTAEIVAIVRAKGAEKIAIVGHSWGGILALESLKSLPTDSVKAVVLISTPISYHCQSASATECQLRGLNEPSMEELFLSLQERTTGDCVTFLRNIFSSFDSELFARIDKNYLNKFDLRSTLGRLGVPILVIAGADDLRVPARIQRSYKEFNAGLQYFEIEGAGHFPFFLGPQRHQLLRELETFLKTINTPAPP